MPTTDTIIDIIRAVYDGGTALNVNSGGTSTYATQIDEASATVTYVGKAATGAATASAVWQIQRLTTTGADLAVTWADGDSNYNNVWDNRTSLSYN